MQRDRSHSTLGRRYFSHGPLRSYHFWVSTALFVIVVFETAYYTTKLASRLDAEGILSMTFPAVVAAVLWLRVLMAHKDVYRACRLDTNDDWLAEDPRAEKILNSLAYMLYAGFALAMFMVGCLYVAAARVMAAAGR